jgi:hypothetical protein
MRGTGPRMTIGGVGPRMTIGRGVGVPVTLGLVPRVHAGGSVCPFVDPRHKAKDDKGSAGPRMTKGVRGWRPMSPLGLSRGSTRVGQCVLLWILGIKPRMTWWVSGGVSVTLGLVPRVHTGAGLAFLSPLGLSRGSKRVGQCVLLWILGIKPRMT